MLTPLALNHMSPRGVNLFGPLKNYIVCYSCATNTSNSK